MNLAFGQLNGLQRHIWHDFGLQVLVVKVFTTLLEEGVLDEFAHDIDGVHLTGDAAGWILCPVHLLVLGFVSLRLRLLRHRYMLAL